MSGVKSVITVLSKMALVELEADAPVLYSAFSRSEREYLATRHIRTTAGWLVMKKSLLKLLGKRSDRAFTEKDIVLKCRSDGCPVIIELADMSDLLDNIHISISHTRSTAYGLAVLQED